MLINNPAVTCLSVCVSVCVCDSGVCLLQRVLKDVVAEKLPTVHNHLTLHQCDLSLFTFNWFLVIFVDSLPANTFLCIWDSFLYEGSKVTIAACFTYLPLPLCSAACTVQRRRLHCAASPPALCSVAACTVQRRLHCAASPALCYVTCIVLLVF